MTHVARALAEALGLAPAPWPEGAVKALLRRWAEIGPGARAGHHLVNETRWREPGWLLLHATVAVKVSRCPANTLAELGSEMPAVELVIRAEWELDEMRSEWRREELDAERRGKRLPRAEVQRREREGRQTDALLAKLRETKAYRRGITYLSREFAWCARLDPVFREWVRNE